MISPPLHVYHLSHHYGTIYITDHFILKVTGDFEMTKRSRPGCFIFKYIVSNLLTTCKFECIHPQTSFEELRYIHTLGKVLCFKKLYTIIQHIMHMATVNATMEIYLCNFDLHRYAYIQ